MTPNDETLLAQTLDLIERVDPSAHGTEHAPDAEDRYADRNRLIYGALAIAARGGLNAGVAIDPNEPAWPVAYIDLPTGQVSWHLPRYPGTWDGHDGPTKTARISDYIHDVARSYRERLDHALAAVGLPVTADDPEADRG